VESQVSASLRAGYEHRDARRYVFDDNGEMTIIHDGPALEDLRASQADAAAFDLGVQLGEAWESVQSASVSEYQADVERFDRIATLINHRYGPVVGLSTDEDAFQLRARS
jgi:hypothetical protein